MGGSLIISKIKGNTLYVNSNQAPYQEPSQEQSTHRVVFNMVVDRNRLHEVQTIEVEHGSTLNEMPYVSLSGYTFAGWYDQLIDGNPLTTYTRITEDKTYYAHWTEGETSSGGDAALPRITFHFDAGYPIGQCNIRSVTVQQVHGMSEEQANKYIPSCPGNEFIGWFYQPMAMGRIDSDGNTESSWNWPVHVGFPLPVLENHGSVVAHWALETAPDEPIDNPESDFHTVYFEDGNHSGTFITSGPFQMKVRHGTSITKEQVDEMFVPKCPNGTFLGWHDSPDVDSETVFPIQVNDDVHLYAHWYVVPLPDPRMCRLNLDGGNPYGMIPAPSYLAAIRYGTVLTEDDINNMFQPSVDGNEFIGWYGSIDGDDKIAFPITVKSDTILYAHWIEALQEIPEIPEGSTRLWWRTTETTSTRDANTSYWFSDTKISGTLTTSNLYVDGHSGSEATKVEIGTSVTEIDSEAFMNCVNLKEVTIPLSVETIGDNAFLDCFNLKKVEFKDRTDYWVNENIDAQQIGIEYDGIITSQDGEYESGEETFRPETKIWWSDGSFSLIQVNGQILPGHVQTNGHIKDDIIKVRIGTNVKSIGEGAFWNCHNLQEVEIPNTVTSIGMHGFRDCHKLKEVVVPDSVTMLDWYSFYHDGGLEKITLGSGVNFIGHLAFDGCSNLKELNVTNIKTLCEISYIDSRYGSECINANPLEYAQELHLNGVLVTDLVVPEGTTVIGDKTFMNCKHITSASIPSSVKRIGNQVFSGCESLTSVTMAEGVESIGKEAFRDCIGLTTLKLPDSVKTIGNNVFWGCSSITEIDLGNGLESLSTQTFRDCTSLETITIGEGLHSLGSTEFLNCNNLSSFNVSANNSTYSSKNGLLMSKDGTEVFVGVKGDVVIPDGVTTIGGAAFWGCFQDFNGLKSITLPDSVKTLGVNAFRNCHELRKIVIGAGLESIGDLAFSSCPISEIQVSEENQTYKSVNNIILSKDGKTLVQGPHRNVAIPDGVVDIGTSAFSGVTELENLVLPETVENIGTYAFSGCSGLTGELKLPESIKKIGYGAFSNCTGISETLTIPDGVTQIDKYAFSGCAAIENMVLPDGLSLIEDGMFSGCSELKNVKLPDTITKIGDNSFKNCTSLNTLIIPSSVVNIKRNAFSGSGITNLVFLGKTIDEVKSIESGEATYGNINRKYYPWGLDENNIHVENDVIVISWDLNGGVDAHGNSFVADSPIGMYQRIYTSAPSVTKADHSFNGWWNGTTRMTRTTVALENATYTANWIYQPEPKPQITDPDELEKQMELDEQYPISIGLSDELPEIPKSDIWNSHIDDDNETPFMFDNMKPLGQKWDGVTYRGIVS